MEKIIITTEYITLVQALKFQGMIGQGSDFHAYIEENEVLVNNEVMDIKGKKLYPGAIITVNGMSYIISRNED